MARTGFLLWGLAALWLVALRRIAWGRIGAFFIGAFGVFMVGTAAYSHRPWQSDVSYDAFEDLLHSVTATGMGLAFAAGVAAILVARRGSGLGTRLFDVVAITASAGIPLAMVNAEQVAGALQRVLFAMAYLWFGAEAVRATAARSAVE